ncbi:MAG: GNAT family N-acetyltransferase [Acidobacteriota bacterium]|nr:GNAT family N-acetyltransferase [Acidobacteriota bacterium]MDH3786345.1 GNAT family N-acetyltransferase [Acidobacteriota bacterium]
MNLRNATVADAAACLATYGPIVRDTAISFELEVPDRKTFTERIAVALDRYAWLVAEDDDGLLGYAYATAHRDREAYRYAVETSVYVGEARRRGGVGKALYHRLFEVIADRGFYNAYAGVTVPNPASLAFHKACGFVEIGVFPAVGFKLGAWQDVSWWHRNLRTGTPED